MPRPTIVILAAGQGRRYGGPKQLEPLGPAGETLLEYTLYDARRAGCGQAVLVVRPDTRAAFRAGVEARVAGRFPLTCVPQRLDDLPPGRTIPAGRTKPWGTAHAVLAARDTLDGPFVVANADDCYGPRALATLVPALAAGDGVLVTYRLQDTLPATGTVSRALCTVDAAGYLRGLREIAAIERDGTNARYADDAGAEHSVRGATPVSMNLWGLPAAAVPMLEERFDAFLAAHGDSTDAEYRLPDALDALLGAGDLRVRTVAANDRWCGITRPADVPDVRRTLADRTAAGDYPSPLR